VAHHINILLTSGRLSGYVRSSGPRRPGFDYPNSHESSMLPSLNMTPTAGDSRGFIRTSIEYIWYWQMASLQKK